jgi:hypothetical protein
MIPLEVNDTKVHQYKVLTFESQVFDNCAKRNQNYVVYRLEIRNKIFPPMKIKAT